MVFQKAQHKDTQEYFQHTGMLPCYFAIPCGNPAQTMVARGLAPAVTNEKSQVLAVPDFR